MKEFFYTSDLYTGCAIKVLVDENITPPISGVLYNIRYPKGTPYNIVESARMLLDNSDFDSVDKVVFNEFIKRFERCKNDPSV